MHLFYTPDIASGNYILNEEETKHAVRVLRLEIGSKVNLVDGKGGFFEAEIVVLDKRNAELKILTSQHDYRKRNYKIHLAVAPTKNIDRFEWLLEKATEIGVDVITPLLCTRSERKEIKIERLNKVITSAVKQSVQAYHPKINPLTKFEKFICDRAEDQKYIAHCSDSVKTSLKEDLRLGSNCLILIGPEGDFSDQEIDSSIDNNFKSITLGNNRLRTETAALEACFEVNFLNR